MEQSGPGAESPALKPSKGCMQVFPSMASLTQQSDSQRDTQITPPARLFSAPPERDEYLWRLLGKGRKQAPQSHTGTAPGSSMGFRVPDPVPQRAGPLAPPAPSAAPSVAAEAAAAHRQNASSEPCAAAEPTYGTRQSAGLEWSLSNTQKRLGAEAAAALRSTVVSHQVAFLEQLYDLHRAVGVQKLLVRNCPEVQLVMEEGARLIHAATAEERAAKRRRTEKGGLHPNSQFAAGPLPGDTTTGDGSGSGDDGSGGGGSGGDGDSAGNGRSGGDGSGGGSTSPQPQPQLRCVDPRTAPPLFHPQAAPSGASAAPMASAFQHPALPWQAAMPGAAYPVNAQAANPYASSMMMMDPMSWWYHNYYGQRQAGGQVQMGMGVQPQAAAAAPLASAPKWWQDPAQTFGPPADLEAVGQAAGQGRLPRCPAGVVEVESAPPSQEVPPSHRAAAAPAPQRRVYCGGQPLVAPVQPRRRAKRQLADAAAEASSGTTGLHNDLGCAHALADDATAAHRGRSPRGRHNDTTAAELLLSISSR